MYIIKLMATALLCSVAPLVVAKGDPNHIQPVDKYMYKIGKKVLGDEYPDRNAPGYMLGRGSLGMVIAMAKLIKSGMVEDAQTQILSPLYSAEAAWPDRESDNGRRINSTLWACRDSVIIQRMMVQAFIDKQFDHIDTLSKFAGVKRMECSVALIGVGKILDDSK